MVELVILYEEVKICILNLLYSCIVWVGILIGQQYIYESMLIDVIYVIVDCYVMEDVILCFGDNGIDLLIYWDVVFKCFINFYIQDINQCVVVDGFLKILVMIVLILQECYQCGVCFEVIVMLLVLFFVFMEQWYKGILLYQYQDGILDVQVVYEMFEVQDLVVVFVCDKVLFGDFVNNVDFLVLMCEKVVVVYMLIN